MNIPEGITVEELADAMARMSSGTGITAAEAATGFDGLMKSIRDKRDYQAAPLHVQIAWRLLGRRPTGYDSERLAAD